MIREHCLSYDEMIHVFNSKDRDNLIIRGTVNFEDASILFLTGNSARWIISFDDFYDIELDEKKIPLDFSKFKIINGGEIIQLGECKILSKEIIGMSKLRIAYVSLPEEQIEEIQTSDNAENLVIEMFVDHDEQKIILFFGGTTEQYGAEYSFDVFEPSGNGTIPDFTDAEIIDFGQSLRFGKYEAAVDSLF